MSYSNGGSGVSSGESNGLLYSVTGSATSSVALDLQVKELGFTSVT